MPSHTASGIRKPFAYFKEFIPKKYKRYTVLVEEEIPGAYISIPTVPIKLISFPALYFSYLPFPFFY